MCTGLTRWRWPTASLERADASFHSSSIIRGRLAVWGSSLRCRKRDDWCLEVKVGVLVVGVVVLDLRMNVMRFEVWQL